MQILKQIQEIKTAEDNINEPEDKINEPEQKKTMQNETWRLKRWKVQKRRKDTIIQYESPSQDNQNP